MTASQSSIAASPLPASADRRARAAASRRNAWLALALLTAIGACLRFVGLDWQSLWLDEVSSLRNAHVFGAEGLHGLARIDQIAPLHSITLWLSTGIFGDTAFAVRLPSVLAGVLTIPLTYAAALRMFRSTPVALVSAALVAISPFAIWFSQEGRMYALLLVAAVAYVTVAWPIVRRPLNRAELAALAVITAIGLGMHHYMALLSLSFGLFLLIKDRGITGRSLAWGMTQIVAALVFSYWMVLTADTLDNPAGNAKPGFLLWVPYAFYSFLAGFSFGPSTRELAMARGDIVRVVLDNWAPIAILAAAAGALLWAGARSAWRSPAREAGLWLAIWVLGPVLLAVLATFVTNVQFNVRYVIAAFPGLMIVLALGLVALPWPRFFGGAGAWPRASVAAGVVFGLCLLAATANYYVNPRYAKADTRGLARFVRDMPTDAMLVADNSRIVKLLDHYRAPTPGQAMQVDYTTTAKSPQAVWRNMRRLPAGAAREIWLIEYRSWEADPDHFLRGQLDRNARLVDVHDWNGVAVRRYRPIAQARATDGGAFPAPPRARQS